MAAVTRARAEAEAGSARLQPVASAPVGTGAAPVGGLAPWAPVTAPLSRRPRSRSGRVRGRSRGQAGQSRPHVAGFACWPRPLHRRGCARARRGRGPMRDGAASWPRLAGAIAGAARPALPRAGACQPALRLPCRSAVMAGAAPGRSASRARASARS
jgi:hypothetical protein